VWWKLAGLYVALTALMLWFLYRSTSSPGAASDDRPDSARPKKRAKPRARNKLATR